MKAVSVLMVLTGLIIGAGAALEFRYFSPGVTTILGGRLYNSSRTVLRDCRCDVMATWASHAADSVTGRIIYVRCYGCSYSASCHGTTCNVDGDDRCSWGCCVVLANSFNTCRT